MRPRSIAASAATIIATVSMSPLVAQAAGQITVYVDGASSACTDSGSGTQAAPFCTIQAAADVAEPGDVVSVAAGSYAAFTVSRSGTASAPIVFTGNGVRTALGLSSSAIAGGVTLNAVDYVEVEAFRILPATGNAATVNGGSNLTFANDLFGPQDAASKAETAVHVTGGASAVTVRDSNVDAGLTVDGGSTGTILTTNRFSSDLASAVLLSGAVNTAVTSNTIDGCGSIVSATGSSTGTSIENNVIQGDETLSTTDANCAPTAQSYGISVDTSSAGSTTADYNDVYVAGTGSAAYAWNSATYTTGSGLSAVTGQGGHDYNSAAGMVVAEKSPLINSANSAAIGEQSVDINGKPRTDDPLVTPTGAGPYNDYDRGAYQFQDPIAVVTRSFSPPTQVPAGAAFPVSIAMTDTWSDKLEYQFMLAGSSTVLATDNSGSITTSFPTDGTYDLEVEARPQGATTPYTRIVGQAFITVVAPAPLTPRFLVEPEGSTSVYVNASITTDAWNVTSVTYDFGDGTSAVASSRTTSITHTYATPGNYTITATMTDAGGNTATTSNAFTTPLPPAGNIVNLTQSPESPGISAGFGADPAGANFAQAAVTTMPDQSNQYAAVTKTGQVQFTILAPGTWQGWTTLSQPGVTAESAGIAGMPNSSTQIIEVTSTGVLKHIVRNANGSWQSSGWGSPAGSTGIIRAAITAMPNGDSQLVAVTSKGTLEHNIRFANGSWQGWRTLNQPAVVVKDASLAGMPGGSTQIIEVTSAGVLKHNVRNANGSWQSSGWGSPAGSTGITRAAIAALYGGPSEIVAVTTGGSLVYDVRNVDGSWTNWSTFNTDAGGGAAITSISNVDVAGLSDANSQIVAVSAG
jgi:hypothetical protein